MRRFGWIAAVGIGLACSSLAWGQVADSGAESAETIRAVRQWFAGNTGRPGVVLHLGDSITYANPYGQWARSGSGQTDADRAVLKWMHTNARDDQDGWFLAANDHPDGGRSETACSGVRLDEFLAGGKRNLPSLEQMLTRYRPQMAVMLLGTNDVTAQRTVPAFRRDLLTAVGIFRKAKVIPILNTLPPHHHRPDLAKQFSQVIREIARTEQLPLIDLEAEILARRPTDWNGTLMNRNDVHPSASINGVTPTSAPTAENLRNSGYLLRGWLTVRKIAELKRAIIDAPATSPAPTPVPMTGVNPDAEGVKLPVNRDLWLSTVDSEAQGNNGGANKLKLKSYQEFSLVDLDATALRGRVIRSATLHVKLAGPERLHRITISSVSAPWIEGKSSNYQPETGASSFARRVHPDGWWSVPGSDFTSVSLGLGHSLWRMADATPPDANGWQQIPVDPRVVQLRLAGISEGFLMFDDTGSEWSRNGEAFQMRPFPNRYVFSRESGTKSAPYWTISVGETDTAPPNSPQNAAWNATTGTLEWDTPTDVGPAGVVGFRVRIRGQSLPAWQVPLATQPGNWIRMPIDMDGFPQGTPLPVEIVSVDGVGNVSKPIALTMTLPIRQRATLPGTDPQRKLGSRGAIPFGDHSVAVVDELATVTNFPPAASSLWHPDRKTIRLTAAKDEIIGFRLLSDGEIPDVTASLTMPTLPGVRIDFGHCVNVPANRDNQPDPVLPVSGATPIGPKSGQLLVELHIPREAKAGSHRGELTLRRRGSELTLAVELTVWNLALSRELNFLPEMNAYGLPGAEREWYRLAHQHRTVLNVVPYSQRGIVSEGAAPRIQNGQYDWRDWDRRYGPLLDGSAFADLPRAGVPIDCLYLPIHENWPGSMAEFYNGSYWADQAFPPEYRQRLVDTSRAFAKHFDERGYHRTRFHFFLNGKNNFKQNGWSRGSSPWLLDEPAHLQDFWALRWYGAAFHQGVREAGGTAKMLFRADISRPQWQRDTLDGLLDYNVLSSAMRDYHRLITARQSADQQLILEYGTANTIGSPNLHGAAWCVDAWCLGAHGVIPWQTIGTPQAWKQPEETALFYPTDSGKPVPSLRLKAYRRGQQDVEYLVQLAAVAGLSQLELGQLVRAHLQLQPKRGGTGFVGGEDAGRVNYGNLSGEAFAAFRERAARYLESRIPPQLPNGSGLPTPPRRTGPTGIGGMVAPQGANR
ncbi:GDSL-type esterase/lipase family protein [Tuwongella immobilis]|uniref:SGNH hydrolase-type esterase domain-containing protein n=1 Tax=Tuwongella immobilis TaxID=692036 RepID=A0A6C2YTR9_9BACT|nr:GDSL-type esterase/lipase family protein [Tuwongella immobilis]VIP04315.1 Uncharacterized protein OS=Chthoniobacter flavus Ellin428 GN=CfE428DRAFT_4969 PE=4 SV=1: Lipase_GDSL_2: DUF4091 [Tuwongella immobilis]VTS05992.1 Uncharacterized protein OS=Chthoniobacter flavus Ellin428 GN=CfE428DRAFT_4969 PE=4 SV=1: Lipase_GDSL_2: DUF4091 [Tuwongella immobilis]